MITPSKALIRLLSSLGFDLNFVHNFRNNQKPNLWLFWKNTIKAPNVIAYDSVFFSIVHAQTSLVKRRILWEDLQNLCCYYDIPWVIMGDFNVVLLSFEKLEGNLRNRTSCEGFANFVNFLDLIQPNNEGMRFSWTNNRKGDKNIKALLQRCLVNQRFLDLHENASWKVLQRISLDHSPITLESFPMPKARNILFRFPKSKKHPISVSKKQETSYFGFHMSGLSILSSWKL
ncbi:hypothetical protein AMTRI_Chr06g174300 [Amborella trichopoda]